MDNKRKKRLILASIGFAIFLMAFTSFGSFNPISIGFWSSIFGGITWYLIMYYLLRKYSISNDKYK
jgi:uncharacterized RDD family membrane protein YckC